MNNFLGLVALLVAGGSTVLLASRYKDIAVVLGVAFSARAAAALFHFYVSPLPNGKADAVTFERFAWEWGQNGLVEALSHFTGADSYFYAWLMSLLYAVTDRSLLMLQATSVFVGVVCVFFAWRLAREIFGEREARKVAWVMALFPTVIQYSALTMREVWIVLFFTVGLIGVVRWAKSRRLMPAVKAVMAFGAATFFHGGMFVAVIAFLGLIAARSARQLIRSISRGQIKIFAAVGLTLVLAGFGSYIVSGVSLPKLGTPANAIDPNAWTERFERRASMEDAEARYGKWQVPNNPIDLVWIIPAKSVYFLFSPAPWDLRTPAHLIGLFDAVLYLFLALLAWGQRRIIWAHPGGRAISLIFLAMILTFGIGTGNFGTAVRHRAKFVVVLIVLASRGLPRFRFHGRSIAGQSAPSKVQDFDIKGS